MTGYEHEIKGTVVVNSGDPGIMGQARYVVCKVVGDGVWYYASFNELERARDAVTAGTFYPMFIIDKGEP